MSEPHQAAQGRGPRGPCSGPEVCGQVGVVSGCPGQEAVLTVDGSGGPSGFPRGRRGSIRSGRDRRGAAGRWPCLCPGHCPPALRRGQPRGLSSLPSHERGLLSDRGQWAGHRAWADQAAVTASAWGWALTAVGGEGARPGLARMAHHSLPNLTPPPLPTGAQGADGSSSRGPDASHTQLTCTCGSDHARV